MRGNKKTNTALVPVRKVCYGSVYFYFHQRNLQELMQERDMLKETYDVEEDGERYRVLARMIRLYAALVYFPRKAIFVQPPEEKKQEPKKIAKNGQQTLF